MKARSTNILLLPLLVWLTLCVACTKTVAKPIHDAQLIPPRTSTVEPRYQSTVLRGFEDEVALYFWKGGSIIDKQILLLTVKKTVELFHRLIPEKVNKNNIHQFLMEICATESDLGRLIKQYRGPALSIYQILPTTYDWLVKQSQKDEASYKILAALYNPSKSQLWNRTENVPYTTAMCFLYIFHVTNGEFKNIDTRHERAKLWKRRYNTDAGKGTVEIYLQKSHRHINTVAQN